MKTIEFTAELTDKTVLAIPLDIVARLPKSGKARIIIVTDEAEDGEWCLGAYEHFLRDDEEEDAIYESLR